MNIYVFLFQILDEDTCHANAHGELDCNDYGCYSNIWSIFIFKFIDCNIFLKWKIVIIELKGR